MDIVYVNDYYNEPIGSEERTHAFNRAKAHVKQKYGVNTDDPIKFLNTVIEEESV